MQVALEPRPTSAGWYVVACGLVGIGIAIALTAYNQKIEVVETMQRRVMPGSHEIPFADGLTTIYYEHEARIGDRHYSTPADLAFRCTLRDLVGKPIDLFPPASAAGTYAAGDFAGRSVWDVHIVAPGRYVLSCDGREPYVVAVAGGIGAWLVVAIAGGLVPAVPGLVVAVIVMLKRRRWHKRKR